MPKDAVVEEAGAHLLLSRSFPPIPRRCCRGQSCEGAPCQGERPFPPGYSRALQQAPARPGPPEGSRSCGPRGSDAAGSESPRPGHLLRPGCRRGGPEAERAGSRPSPFRPPLTCFEDQLLVVATAEEPEHGDEEDPARVLNAEDGAVAPHGGQHHHPAPAALGGLRRRSAPGAARAAGGLLRRGRRGLGPALAAPGAPLAAVLPPQLLARRRAGQGGRGGGGVCPRALRLQLLAHRRHPRSGRETLQARRSRLPFSSSPSPRDLSSPARFSPWPRGLRASCGARSVCCLFICPPAGVRDRARPAHTPLFPPRRRRFILKGGLPRGRQRQERFPPRRLAAGGEEGGRGAGERQAKPRSSPGPPHLARRSGSPVEGVERGGTAPWRRRRQQRAHRAAAARGGGAGKRRARLEVSG